MKYITSEDPESNEGLVISFSFPEGEIVAIVNEDGQSVEINSDFKNSIQLQIHSEIKRYQNNEENNLIDGTEKHTTIDFSSLIGEESFEIDYPDFCLGERLKVTYDEFNRLISVCWDGYDDEPFLPSESLKSSIQSYLGRI